MRGAGDCDAPLDSVPPHMTVAQRRCRWLRVGECAELTDWAEPGLYVNARSKCARAQDHPLDGIVRAT
jgi:hypothetical protein